MSFKDLKFFQKLFLISLLPLIFNWMIDNIYAHKSNLLVRQRDSVVRAGDLNTDLNTEDPGLKSRLGLLNGFVLGDPRGKFTTLCK